MDDKVAQATLVPNSGGSNANDFQPTTQNPQTVPGNLFQQQGGVQDVTNTQELLGDQQNARIVVTSEPASQPAAARANESPLGFIALLLIITAVVIVLAVIIRRKRQAVPEAALAPAEPAQPELPQKTTKAKTTPDTKTAKKKTAKKQKRKRR